MNEAEKYLERFEFDIFNRSPIYEKVDLIKFAQAYADEQLKKKMPENRVWCFNLNIMTPRVGVTEFEVYTNNDPDYYLEQSKKIDKENGWNGTIDPIRDMWISDIHSPEYIPKEIEIENITNNKY